MIGILYLDNDTIDLMDVVDLDAPTAQERVVAAFVERIVESVLPCLRFAYTRIPVDGEFILGSYDYADALVGIEVPSGAAVYLRRSDVPEIPLGSYRGRVYFY